MNNSNKGELSKFICFAERMIFGLKDKRMIDVRKLRITILVAIMTWGMQAAGQEVETYKLPFDNVMECSMMPDMQHALIITRTPLLKPEYAIVRDLKQGKNLWKINLENRNLETTITREGVIVSGELTPKKPTVNLYETQGGKKRYQLQIIPVYINEEDNVVMGYKKKTSKQLECYQLSTGELMWKADAAPNKYGIWNDHIRISPHRLVVIADDLLLIDTEKGVLNHAPLKTDINYMSLNAKFGVHVSVRMGVGLGFSLSASGRIPLGSQLGNINSNLLSIDDAVYVSDRNHLFCFDTELRERWRHEFPARTACHADIRMVNDTLVMLNEGYGVYEDGNPSVMGLPVSAGKMFYATYDPQTGAECSFNPIKGDWDERQFGPQLMLETENVYVDNAAQSCLEMVDRPARSLAVYDTRGQLMVVDNNDATIATIPQEDLYHLVASTSNRLVFANTRRENSVWVTDLDRHVIRHMDVNYINLSLTDDKLVVITTDEIRIFNL